MESLSHLEKRYLKSFCDDRRFEAQRSKRVLLQMISDALSVGKITMDDIESLMEDVGEQLAREAFQNEQKEQERIFQNEQKGQERIFQKEQVEQQRTAKLLPDERQIQLLQLQLDIERLRANSPREAGLPINNSNHVELPKVKISQYISTYENRTDIGMFLTNFERLGAQLNVPNEQWAVQLIKPLPSEVASVVAKMSAQDEADYGKVNLTLLVRFKLSAETFRLRFRKARRKEGHTFTEFGYSLESNLSQWISGSNIDQDFDKLKELISLQQFYRNRSGRWTMFLRTWENS